MDRPSTILVYSDYKSPYALLAKDLIYELEDQFDVHFEWLPYTLDIPSYYLGTARLDAPLASAMMAAASAETAVLPFVVPLPKKYLAEFESDRVMLFV